MQSTVTTIKTGIISDFFLGAASGSLRNVPHLVQSTWFGSVGAAQFEQNFFSTSGGTPQPGQATACG